jgi:hypothetical protein
MADTFQLPIEDNGEEKEYPAKILRFGFTHKVEVTIDGVVVTFEPDEEKNYRAVTGTDHTTNISKTLLEEISKTLQYLLHDQ